MPRRANSKSFGAKDGNDPRSPNRRPGPGAPTKSFKHFLANVRNSAAAQRALRQAAEDAHGRNFGHAWKYLTDYDDDKPAQRIAIDVDQLKGMTNAQLEAIVKQAAKR